MFFFVPLIFEGQMHLFFFALLIVEEQTLWVFFVHSLGMNKLVFSLLL